MFVQTVLALIATETPSICALIAGLIILEKWLIPHP